MKYHKDVSMQAFNYVYGWNTFNMVLGNHVSIHGAPVGGQRVVVCRTSVMAFICTGKLIQLLRDLENE